MDWGSLKERKRKSGTSGDGPKCERNMSMWSGIEAEILPETGREGSYNKPRQPDQTWTRACTTRGSRHRWWGLGGFQGVDTAW